MRVLWLVLFVSFVARAETAAFRMGMEIEIPRRVLQHFVDNFDWDKVEHDIKTNPTYARFRPELEQGPLKARPKAELAELALKVTHGPYTYEEGYPPLRTDVPAEVAEALRGMRWHEDGVKLEFSHIDPLESPEAYLASLRRFAKVFHIESAIDSPSSAAGRRLSYHLHISRADSRPIDETLHAYNQLMLVRMAEAGTAEDLFGGKRMSMYSIGLYERGIVRLVDRDHFELRRHVMKPEDEIAELHRIFSLSPQEGRQTVMEMIQELLTPATVKKLIALSPAEAFTIVNGSHHHARPEHRRVSLENPEVAREMAQAFYASGRPPLSTHQFTARLKGALERKEPGAILFAKHFFAEMRRLAPEPPLPQFAESPAFVALLTLGPDDDCGPVISSLARR